MRNGRNLLVGMFISVVGMVGLLSVGRAEARKGDCPCAWKSWRPVRLILTPVRRHRVRSFPVMAIRLPQKTGRLGSIMDRP